MLKDVLGWGVSKMNERGRIMSMLSSKISNARCPPCIPRPAKRISRDRSETPNLSGASDVYQCVLKAGWCHAVTGVPVKAKPLLVWGKLFCGGSCKLRIENREPAITSIDRRDAPMNDSLWRKWRFLIQMEALTGQAHCWRFSGQTAMFAC
jgi:hypothetical protein